MQSQWAKLNFLNAKFNASTFHAMSVDLFYGNRSILTQRQKQWKRKINLSYLFILSCQTGGKYLNEISVKRLNLMRRTNSIQIARSQKFLMNVRAWRMSRSLPVYFSIFIVFSTSLIYYRLSTQPSKPFWARLMNRCLQSDAIFLQEHVL